MPKKNQNKKNQNEKSILGKNAIFTPNVINDIHIKSQLRSLSYAWNGINEKNSSLG